MLVNKKTGKSFSIPRVLLQTFLIVWMLIQIFPLYWLAAFSLKSNDEIFSSNPLGLPREWLFKNYKIAIADAKVGLYLFNSAFVTASTILLTLTFALMASYALTRMRWRWRNPANNIFMLGLTIPLHASLLPIFLILRDMKLLNTYWSLIIPYTAFNIPMAILMFSGFMSSIPFEMEESACMDGCSVYKTFINIILPLMRPALATVSIFTFLHGWNELMFAVTFISKQQYKTLTVGISSLVSEYGVEWGPIGAGLMAATIPTLIVYTFLNKQVQQSLIIGAIKG
jgi:raffinose/stachyose/melibiose transport system permease protein